MTLSNHRKLISLLPLLGLLAIVSLACAQSSAPEQPGSPPTVASSSDTTPAAGSEESKALQSTPEEPIPTADKPDDPNPTPIEAKARAMPEIPQISGIDAWLNTDTELQVADLTADGKVVLVDFWTYTCINCLRTLPYLRAWWSQYEDDGLVILGIHSPEFDFEKDYDNVAKAIETNDVGWPVAQDNDMVTWSNFENRFWPAKYLFNSHGEQIYSHFGEGGYGETEQHIRNALVEAGADLSDDPASLPDDQVRDPAFQSARESGNAPITRELYAGWHRNVGVARAGRLPYVAQEEYFEAIAAGDSNAAGVLDATVPQEIQQHVLYFQGQWSVEPERVRHARLTQNLEDYLALNYAAKSVNVVLTSDSGEPYRVVITQDGAMLTQDNAGQDIQWDETGQSYILVDTPRMYAIIDNAQYTREAILTMRSNSDDFGIFAFTFGVYAEGP